MKIFISSLETAFTSFSKLDGCPTKKLKNKKKMNFQIWLIRKIPKNISIFPVSKLLLLNSRISLTKNTNILYIRFFKIWSSTSIMNIFTVTFSSSSSLAMMSNFQGCCKGSASFWLKLPPNSIKNLPFILCLLKMEIAI